MDIKSAQNYQSSLRSLLNQALVEALKRNEAQAKTWKDYKKAHEKVKKGLEILPQELTTNCMVPIGRKALMKGKLVHTNEILVCLGEGYFAKYSAKQAIAVCNRRIKQADEMIINLEKEQNLLEMRQSLPIDCGMFGDEERKEILEPYVEEEEKEWRIKHRQREKEYRQKLAQLREQEKTQIHSEEDLWQRLDELELQEELEDEIDRLQEDDFNYYGEDNEDNDDSYEEEECDFSEDETSNETIEKRLAKLKDSKIPKHEKDLFEKENLDKETDRQSSSTYSVPNSQQASSSTSFDTTILEMKSSRETLDEVRPEDSTTSSTDQESIQNLETRNANTKSTKQDISNHIPCQSSETSITTSEGESADVSSSQSEAEIERLVRFESQSQDNGERSLLQTAGEEGGVFSGENNDSDDRQMSKSKPHKRRVSFTDKIQVNVFEKSTRRSFDEPLRRERESSSESDAEDEVEKLKIIEDLISVGADFSSIDEPTEDSTEYGDEEDDLIRIEVKHSNVQPRSASSRRDNAIEDPTDIYRIFCKPKSILKRSSSDVGHSQNIAPPADDVFDEETEAQPFGSSYTIIVKDVEERKPDFIEANVSSIKTRPPSRFKMARSGIK